MPVGIDDGTHYPDAMSHLLDIPAEATQSPNFRVGKAFEELKGSVSEGATFSSTVPVGAPQEVAGELKSVAPILPTGKFEPASLGSVESSSKQTMSDEQPDEVKAGQQYAMSERRAIPQMEGLTAEIDQQAAGMTRGASVPGPGKVMMKPQENSVGYRTRRFDFINEEGKPNGSITLTKKGEGGKDLYVDLVRAEGGPNSLGSSAMRDVLKQIKEHYPDAERLYGFRVSGVRGGSQGKGAENAYLALKPGVKAKTEEEAQNIERMRGHNRESPSGWGSVQGGAERMEDIRLNDMYNSPIIRNVTDMTRTEARKAAAQQVGMKAATKNDIIDLAEQADNRIREPFRK